MVGRTWVFLLGIAAVAVGVSSPGCRTDAPVSKPSTDSVRQLVEDMISWRPSPQSKVVDQDNPYHVPVVKAGDDAVPYLLQALERNDDIGRKQAIGVLGEIGNPKAFESLVAQYLRQPDNWTAISACGCIDADQIPLLFSRLGKTDELLRKFLRPVYGSQWKEVESLNTQVLQRDLAARLDRIRNQCRSRSWPKSG